MKRQILPTVVLEKPRARLLPPIDDELRFDFELEPKVASRPAGVGWLHEAGGVKAAIARWLEEQA